MNNKTNKKITDSEELFKHLDGSTPLTTGLDDFEKEALEGFASLENIELSKKVNDELTKKIEEKYFKKEGSKKPIIYWSMAAGLALIIGLTVFFFNNATKKESLAYSEKAEQTANKLQEMEMNKVQSPATASADLQNAEPQKERNLEGEKADDTKSKTKHAADLDSRTGADVPKSEPGGYVNGPVNAAPKVALEEEQKNNLSQNSLAGAGGKDAGNVNDDYYKSNNKKVEEKAKESDRDEKPADELKKEKLVMQSATGGMNKQDEAKAKKSAERKESRANSTSQAPTVVTTKDAAGEGLATDQLASRPDTKTTNENREKTQADKNTEEKDAKQPVETVSLKGAVAKGDATTEMPMRRSSYFKTTKFANHNDYFKAEIDKNEVLKTNLLKYNKSFRIDLVIDEKGKVTKATADIPEKKCADCKKEMEKIILGMPAWEPAELNNGRTTQQSFYFNYLYK